MIFPAQCTPWLSGRLSFSDWFIARIKARLRCSHRLAGRTTCCCRLCLRSHVVLKTLWCPLMCYINKYRACVCVLPLTGVIANLSSQGYRRVISRKAPWNLLTFTLFSGNVKENASRPPLTWAFSPFARAGTSALSIRGRLRKTCNYEERPINFEVPIVSVRGASDRNSTHAQTKRGDGDSLHNLIVIRPLPDPELYFF